LQMMIWNNSNN